MEKEQNKKLTDLTLREIGVILPMAAIIVALGVYPKPFLSRIEPGAKRFIAEFAAQTQTGKMKAEEQWESKKR